MTTSKGSSGIVILRDQAWATDPRYGAKGDDATNDTTALKNFFDDVIERQIRGHIPGGVYRVDEGQLAFDNNHVDTVWPHITTDGHHATKLKGRNTAVAAILKISNGTAVSGAGKFWLGGTLGGLTFLTTNAGYGTLAADPLSTTNGSATVTVEITGHGLTVGQFFALSGAPALNNIPASELNAVHTVASVVDADNVTFAVTTLANATGSGGGSDVVADPANQHGLQLRGFAHCDIGWMRGDDLRGSTVHIDSKLFNTNNPDPYSVWFNKMRGIEANRNIGRCFYNANDVGFNGNEIAFIRAISCRQGVFHGFGSGNEVKIASVGSCQGWAFEDGTHISAPGGAPNRWKLGIAELDDVEYGLRINRLTQFEFKQVRFNHRKSFTSLNTSAAYWPRVCIDTAGGAAPNSSQGYIQVWHRVEAGGIKSELGTFYDGHSNGNVSGVEIDQQISDNASFGFDDSDYYDNVGSSAQIRFVKKGSAVINNTVHKNSFIARGSSAGTALTIGTDPITTTNGSATIQVTMTGHGLVVGQCFTIQGAAASNGVPAAEINRSHPVVSVVDANNVTVACETNATSSGAAGGAGCSAAKDRSFLNNIGLGTTKGKLAIGTEVDDLIGIYDPVQYEFTVPFRGLYRVHGQISWTGLAAGTRVRLAVYANISTSPNLSLIAEMRAQGANRESLQVGGVVLLTAGTKISMNADQNSAAAIAMSFVGAQDVQFSVEYMGDR